MKRYLRLIRAFWANSLSLDLEYRLNFLISAVTALFSFGAGLLVLDVMFTHAAGLGGWSFHQALALYGVYLFLEEFCVGFLAQNIGRLPEHIQRGNLDFVLLKPVSSQVQVSLSNFTITGLPAYLLGLGIIAYSMVMLGTLTLANLALLIAFLASAMIIIYSIWILLHTLAFWFVRIENIAQLFYAVFEVARFPASALPPAMRAFFTLIIPVAFMTTVPASAAVGMIDWKLAAFAPVVAIAGLWCSHLFWQFALKHYTSASS